MAYVEEGMDVAGRRWHNGLMDTTERTGRMARSLIANGVRSFYVEASPEHESATAGQVHGMASASIPGLVYLSVAEPVYAGEDLELATSAVVYLTPAMARELGTELITLAARVDTDAELGR